MDPPLPLVVRGNIVLGGRDVKVVTLSMTELNHDTR